MIAFPTSGGDEWEYERQGLIGAIASQIDAGRVKVFCINTNHGDSFANGGAHPRHRSWMQKQYDDYVCQEVVPFVRHHCQSGDIGVWTMGASLGGYHAVNTLLKHPDMVKRCYALSGVYDMKQFMGGDYDDNFYFNNPVDYVANLSDPWTLRTACDLRDSSGDRHGAVGEARRGVPHVADALEPRHQPSSRRLGADGGTRLALLAASDARVSGARA